jgi:hypothetical protein
VRVAGHGIAESPGRDRRRLCPKWSELRCRSGLPTSQPSSRGRKGRAVAAILMLVGGPARPGLQEREDTVAAKFVNKKGSTGNYQFNLVATTAKSSPPARATRATQRAHRHQSGEAQRPRRVGDQTRSQCGRMRPTGSPCSLRAAGGSQACATTAGRPQMERPPRRLTGPDGPPHAGASSARRLGYSVAATAVNCSSRSRTKRSCCQASK